MLGFLLYAVAYWSHEVDASYIRRVFLWEEADDFGVWYPQVGTMHGTSERCSN